MDELKTVCGLVNGTLGKRGERGVGSSDEGGEGSGSDSTSDGSVVAIRIPTATGDKVLQRKLQDERTVRAVQEATEDTEAVASCRSIPFTTALKAAPSVFLARAQIRSHHVFSLYS